MWKVVTHDLNLSIQTNKPVKNTLYTFSLIIHPALQPPPRWRGSGGRGWPRRTPAPPPAAAAAAAPSLAAAAGISGSGWAFFIYFSFLCGGHAFASIISTLNEISIYAWVSSSTKFFFAIQIPPTQKKPTSPFSAAQTARTKKECFRRIFLTFQTRIWMCSFRRHGNRLSRPRRRAARRARAWVLREGGRRRRGHAQRGRGNKRQVRKHFICTNKKATQDLFRYCRRHRGIPQRGEFSILKKLTAHSTSSTFQLSGILAFNLPSLLTLPCLLWPDQQARRLVQLETTIFSCPHQIIVALQFLSLSRPRSNAPVYRSPLPNKKNREPESLGLAKTTKQRRQVYYSMSQF